jgi:periplasmic copper chaperone A
MHWTIGLSLMLAVGAATATCLSAQPAGSILLENAWARRAPAIAAGGSGAHGTGGASGTGTMGHGSGNGAVYVTIVNRAAVADALMGAASDAATTVELHETIQEGGVMKMRPRTKFDVPPGGRLEMKPGGYHIMLLGLKRDLKPGDTVSVAVTFEKAGRMTVDAPVR